MSEKVSFERLIEITDADPALMRKLLLILFKNLNDFPDEISKSFHLGRDKETRELAHKFKSSVAYLEMNEFDHALHSLENSSELDLSKEQILDLISTVKYKSQQVQNVIQQKLNSLS